MMNTAREMMICGRGAWVFSVAGLLARSERVFPGVAAVPSLLYRPWSLKGDRLASRPVTESLAPLEVGVAWRRGSPLSEVAQQFLDVVGEHAWMHGTP